MQRNRRVNKRCSHFGKRRVKSRPSSIWCMSIIGKLQETGNSVVFHWRKRSTSLRMMNWFLIHESNCPAHECIVMMISNRRVGEGSWGRNGFSGGGLYTFKFLNIQLIAPYMYETLIYNLFHWDWRVGRKLDLEKKHNINKFDGALEHTISDN